MSCFRSFLAFITGLAYVSIFGTLYHHKVLGALYDQTPNLWRPAKEMAGTGNWMILVSAIVVFGFMAIYCCRANCGGSKPCSVKFGLMTGLILAAVYASGYIYLPISEDLAIAWAIGGLVEGMGLGLIFGAFTCCKTSCCSSQACPVDSSVAMSAPAPAKKAAPKKKSAAKKKAPAKKKAAKKKK